jgi:integrase/recombinase XerC
MTNQLVPRKSDAVAVADDVGAQLYADFLAGRSANTRQAYADDLARFASFLGVASAADAITRLLRGAHGESNGLLFRFRSAMTEAGLSPSTVNRRLSAVRSAVTLARTLGYTDWVPEIVGVKSQTYRDTAGPGIAGARAMLASARLANSAKAARDVAIIRLIFDLALRRAEVAKLDLSDLDPQGQRIWILGKGRTQKEPRSCPPATFAAIDAWLKLRPTVARPDEPALFVNVSNKGRESTGKRITGAGLYFVIAQIGGVTGLKTRPHGLRHASITAALDTFNGDVRAAQQHARHSSPETTMRYDDNRKDLAGKVALGLADILGSGSFETELFIGTDHE